jgi:hypothetical protein
MKKLGFKPFSDLNPSNFFQEKNGDGGIRMKCHLKKWRG